MNTNLRIRCEVRLARNSTVTSIKPFQAKLSDEIAASRRVGTFRLWWRLAHAELKCAVHKLPVRHQ